MGEAGEDEDEDETRRRHGVFFSAGRITMENQKPTYIFAGLAPEEKSDSSERNREEAGGRQEGAAEAASSESCRAFWATGWKIQRMIEMEATWTRVPRWKLAGN